MLRASPQSVSGSYATFISLNIIYCHTTITDAYNAE